MRYFIFFFKCESQTSHQSGNIGHYCESMPSVTKVQKIISDRMGKYTPDQSTIIGFNEVSKDDYCGFFDVEIE